MSPRGTASTLLGAQTANAFLSRYWQKRPLLVRGAVPGFEGLLAPRELMRLAGREDAQARVVLRAGRTWQVHEGPLSLAHFRRLPARGWTLLLHDVDHFLPSARDLLSRFSFVPYARLDDLMVSYAAPGGGVGPHYDSYDVFLLQGPGRRRWRIGHQRDLGLVEDAPLKILRRFRPEQEWVLQAGDLLYLPPGWAHDGVALEACMTYSVGFRAPAWRELTVQFLRFLEDSAKPDGLYQDPRLQAARYPARIGTDMLDQVARRLARIQWRTGDVLRFLGQYLTEPKAHVFFTPPRARLPLEAFAHRARTGGVVLDLKSDMLYRGNLFFLNGESVQVQGRARDALARLADTRELSAVDTTRRGLVALLHKWYAAGYVGLRENDARRRRR